MRETGVGRLNGRVAVITGGTSGIGEGTVERFIEEGAKVVFTGRNAEAGGALAERLGANARFVRGDVRREEDIAEAIETAVSAFGALDVLFSNAGGPTTGELETFTAADFEDAMSLLLGSVLYGMKHAAPVMKRQGRGAIINTTSVGALRTDMGTYLYSIAKAGVTHATRMAGMELGRHGITVNSISPGGIVTPLFFGGSAANAGLEPAHREAKLEKLARNLAGITPLHRAGAPRDIAAAAVFLASDEGAFVNCHDLVVDGGMVAGGRTSYA
ncbi:MAG: 2,5-dichloro-2,5-cyclohexadiene,4-diol dehydrogenase [Caulobacter sp.]|nr:2,5-dichloro-2,5-cyclohexadiene,4-diol dehydrogenase [Caulobacter sp.]